MQLSPNVLILLDVQICRNLLWNDHIDISRRTFDSGFPLGEAFANSSHMLSKHTVILGPEEKGSV